MNLQSKKFWFSVASFLLLFGLILLSQFQLKIIPALAEEISGLHPCIRVRFLDQGGNPASHQVCKGSHAVYCCCQSGEVIEFEYNLSWRRPKIHYYLGIYLFLSPGYQLLSVTGTPETGFQSGSGYFGGGVYYVWPLWEEATPCREITFVVKVPGLTYHGGADWSPAPGSEISGIHREVGAFKIPSGATVYVAGGSKPEVYAESVDIQGRLDANGKGYVGGKGGLGGGDWAGNRGEGPGGGGGPRSSTSQSGGGGGYGGKGGGGGCVYRYSCFGGEGGATYGDKESKKVEMGSGGGGGSGSKTNAGDGGNGGGVIKIVSSTNINISGEIFANGENGESKYRFGSGGAGGGGSGGGILLDADSNLEISGSLTAQGGKGGESHYNPGGGGGGGGRIKLIAGGYINTRGAEISVRRGEEGPGGSELGKKFSEDGTIYREAGSLPPPIGSPDFKFLLSNWGSANPDLNGDGLVNGLDFGKLKSQI